VGRLQPHLFTPTSSKFLMATRVRWYCDYISRCRCVKSPLKTAPFLRLVASTPLPHPLTYPHTSPFFGSSISVSIIVIHTTTVSRLSCHGLRARRATMSLVLVLHNVFPETYCKRRVLTGYDHTTRSVYYIRRFDLQHSLCQAHITP